jgi:hypothetical protein
MTAGHNALRGSGPGQKHAFEDAMAHVGCPDRRIDRRCITCCSPFQPLRHAGLSGVILFTPRERQVPHSIRFWPSSPRPSWRVCWRARWRRPWWVDAPEPGSMPRAMDFGIADHGECACREQAALIAIALLADTAKLVFTSARVLLRHEPNPGREVPSRSEGLGIGNARDQRCCQRRPDARDRVQSLTRRA